MVAMLATAGCSLMTPVQVDTARTGETVVRVHSARSFDEVAASVYGDASLGPAVAELARLEYTGRVPRGTILVLPVREELEARLRRVRAADARFAQGLEEADRGGFRSAADHFRAALDVAPQRLDVRYNYGLALLQSGDAPAATPILEEVARLRPRHADSRYAFGSALRQRRAWDRALAEFEAALSLDSGHAAAAYAIARTQEDRGRPDDARHAYRRFLGRFGDDPLADSARDRLRELEDSSPASADPVPMPPAPR